MIVRRHLHKPIAFTLYGILFGLCFPILALILTSIEHSSSLIEAHAHGGYLIWVIYVTPIVLGTTFYFLGKKHLDSKRINESLEEEIIDKTHEAINNRILYEKHKTIVDMSVTYNHEINNPLAIAVAMVGELQHRYGDSEEIKSLMKSLQRIHEVVRAIDDIKKGAPEDIDYNRYSDQANLIKLNKKAS